MTKGQKIVYGLLTLFAVLPGVIWAPRALLLTAFICLLLFGSIWLAAKEL